MGSQFKFRYLRIALMIGIMLSALSIGSNAQQVNEPALGAVTGLPLPRFVSLKANEANVRRGPNQTHRIDWVLVRKGTPLQVTAEYEHWRRVRDVDGAGGWVHFKLLSNARTALVTSNRVSLYSEPSNETGVVALVEKNVIGELGACNPDWCEFSADGYKGWIRKENIWGVSANEIRE